MSLSKNIELFKDKSVLKFILRQFLDYCQGAVLNNRDDFANDKQLREIYRKLNECITLVEEYNPKKKGK